MKKIILLIAFILMLLLNGNTCNHAHNTECGYNPNINAECNHEHDDSCIENNEDEAKPRICVGPDCPKI